MPTKEKRSRDVIQRKDPLSIIRLASDYYNIFNDVITTNDGIADDEECIQMVIGISHRAYKIRSTLQHKRDDAMMMKLYLLALVLWMAVSLATVAALEDTNDKCQEWAEMGECDKNAGYMQSNCAASCDDVEKAQLADMKELEGLSFFDLKAKDIDGNDFDFSSLKDKVTIIVNVASFCGYTESHYSGLVELYSNLEGTPVEILAFPCNQVQYILMILYICLS